MLWIEGTEAHKAELVRRFDQAPKPMYYRPEFLLPLWQEYLDTHGLAADAVDPDAFVRFAYARALDHRAPLYAAMARKTGASASPLPRSRPCATPRMSPTWWPPPLADIAQTALGKPTRARARACQIMPIRLPSSLPAFDVLARRGRHGHGPERSGPAGHPAAAHRPAEPDAQEDPDGDTVRPSDRGHAPAGGTVTHPHDGP
jgi:hypothetical protein